MGYRKAAEILPQEIIELIQQYVDGEHIYIPRKECNKQQWGTKTQIRQELQSRNVAIMSDYSKGSRISELAPKYYLSEKSIQRIIRESKMNI